nr:M15 family metallopeptidase [Clostridium thermarum]
MAAAGNPVDEKYIRTMKQDLLCLMMAYPEYVKDIEGGDVNGKVYIIMKSGKKILYDDKRKKNHEEKLSNPDVQDMLEQIYPLTATKKLMAENFDPGRARVYDLLAEVYGGSQSVINKNLTNIKVGYHNCQFNKNNQAAEALRSVMEELIPLCKSNGRIENYVFPFSGSFNYRKIAGTNRLSPHSFGIAIDLARDKRDYWKWVSHKEGEKRLSSYPTELVELFEKNNFIWGGKWWHFDILHFEYRPEIIMKAKYFGKEKEEKVMWHDGAPINEAGVKELIEKIDNKLKRRDSA